MRHRPSTLWFTAIPVGALVLVGCGAAMISSAAAPVAVTLIEPEAQAEVVVVQVPEITVTTSSVAPALTTTTTATPTTTIAERETQTASPLEQPLVAIGTDSGPEAARVQQRLVDLGFWLQSTDGEFGVTSRQATMAFQKYHGLTTSGEVAEGWWDGDLGSIYRPKYFNGGIAVHGSYSIPDYPASHGCVRVSTAAMDWIWSEDLMPRGSAVWVHGEIPAE
jgi:lipoprotein-anchoring transpeptidase ErfK/SrfK